MGGIVPSSQDITGAISVFKNKYFMLWGTPAGGGAAKAGEPVCISYAINSKLNATLCPNKLAQFVNASVTALVVEKAACTPVKSR